MLSVVLSSCPPGDAQRIADALVEQRVAACVLVVPAVVSTYRWQGAIQRDAEALLVIKTPSARVAACMEALRQAHPYTVPEMVELPAGRVADAYLAWAIAQTN